MANTDSTVHPAVQALQAELAGIELDVLTSFTVADAMREGSRVTTQKTGGYVDSASSCGIGAAYLSAKARGYIQ